MSEAAAVWVDIADLKPWAANPRDNKKAIDEVAKSIRRFGWGSPIVANKRDGEIIAGHTRFAAASKLKLDKVPVRWLDLDPADAHALALADNKVGEVATWDDAVLRQVLAELKEADESLLADTGFSDDELARLMGDDAPTVLEPEGEPPEVDEKGPVHSVPGEVYQLGPHRLMCGDSTSVDAVETLMSGEKADMVFTDPPYGVSYDGGHATEKRREKLQNDDNVNMYDLPVKNAFLVSKDEAPLYIWFADRFATDVLAGLRDAGYQARCWIIWNKNVAQFGAIGAQYKSKHEPCIYAFKQGKIPNWNGPTNEVTVWDIARDHRNEHHPTQKPTALAERAMSNHTVDLVLDLFGGSGSTLIACAQTGRKARLMELDPRYCDVIRRRWTRWAKANGVEPGTGALDG